MVKRRNTFSVLRSLFNDFTRKYYLSSWLFLWVLQNKITYQNCMVTHTLMSWFKESTETPKSSFSKRNCRKCRSTKSRIKENNDHTRVVRKIRFRSSFKVNESWCKQCGVTPHFSTEQNILKKILRKDELWYNQMRKAFW